ncbi:uncharacterized protein LOC143216433 isoform X2 [Lasioglossum baleicum]|uniref:uncharacterized protein LOC143216433 isoform X2 n=1 Tax=Lasioglossum baleicum TaxID=434251 RepID=UPI003FCD1DBA
MEQLLRTTRREKAKTCNFGNLSDSIVRDKVIASIHNKEFRSKLFQTLNLNLPKILHICKAHEAQNKNNNGNVVEKRQTQTNALHNDKIAVVEASNSNNKKVAEGKQNSNNKVNAKINVEARTNPENDKSCKNIIGTTNQSDTSNKDKTDSKMHNSGSNVLRTACKENNTNVGDKTKTNPKINECSKAKTDTKKDNSCSNILSTACKENNKNIGHKTKTDAKNGNNVSNHTDLVFGDFGSDINDIIGTTNQRHSDSSNKAKMDNSGSTIMSTACKENNKNIGHKTKTDAKNGNNVSNHTDLVFGDFGSDINDIIDTTNQRHSDSSNKAKMDNSGSTIMSTACRENNKNIGDKTKTDVKNGNNVSNHTDLVFGDFGSDINGIIGTTNQRHSDSSNKAKMDNSGSTIISTACRENNNIGDKTKTDAKNGNVCNNVCNHIDLVFGDFGIDIRKTKIINIIYTMIKAKIDSKGMNSNHNMNTARRNSVTSNPKNNKSGKAKTGTKMDNSGSNILSTACEENNVNIGDKTKTNPKNNKSDKAKTDIKMDNNGSNILSTACKENNTNIGNKTNNKTNLKNDKSGNNIIGTTNRRHSDNSNKAKTDSKMHNSGSNILSTACKENKNNIGDKTKTDAKNGNNVSNHTDLVFGKNCNDVNDKVKIDSKGMNSNHNTNTARRSSVTSGTQYRRNCRKCNGKHAERACPAWGHKCENCGERNHFPNCCQMKPLKTTEQHINMSSIENVLNPNHFQHNNQPQPVPPSNYSLVANIEPCYLPSAPVFCETENELYPKLSHMSTFQACALLNPEATVGNTEPKTVATETQNHKKRSNSEKADKCSIS